MAGKKLGWCILHVVSLDLPPPAGRQKAEETEVCYPVCSARKCAYHTGSQSKMQDPVDSLVPSFPFLRSSVVRAGSAALPSEKTPGRQILL